jgi:hypothetical protein
MNMTAKKPKPEIIHRATTQNLKEPNSPSFGTGGDVSSEFFVGTGLLLTALLPSNLPNFLELESSFPVSRFEVDKEWGSGQFLFL